MIRKFPIIPTIIVLAAAATMVALGVWQLGRAAEKAELIAIYSKSTDITGEADFPLSGEGEDVWFRRSSVDCNEVIKSEPVAGTAANGAKGWAMRVTCAQGDAAVLVDLGFTRDLTMPDWGGGAVTGIIAPGPRLVADPPAAGLYPLAKPDPADLPNNHMSYAVQWFIFAATAFVIYFIALRARMRKRD